MRARFLMCFHDVKWSFAHHAKDGGYNHRCPESIEVKRCTECCSWCYFFVPPGRADFFAGRLAFDG